MILLKTKLSVVLMSALVAGLLILVGQTAAQAMSVELSSTPAAYLDSTNLSEVVPSMPNAGELRLSPSYYRDDATKIEGANASVASELRLSPSYYRDDAAKVGAVANAPVASELRFSPSNHQDDPTVIEVPQPAGLDVEQRWGPSYQRDNPTLVFGG